MITLTYQQVLDNAKRAYEEGRLAATRQVTPPTPLASRFCFYRYLDGSCCVVGASFDAETASTFDKQDASSVEDLVLNGLVSVPDEEDLSLIIALQGQNDELMEQRVNHGRADPETLKEFLDTIGVSK